MQGHSIFVQLSNRKCTKNEPKTYVSYRCSAQIAQRTTVSISGSKSDTWDMGNIVYFLVARVRPGCQDRFGFAVGGVFEP